MTFSVTVWRMPATDTGSVTASVTRSTELSGPATSTIVGIDGDLAHDIARGRAALPRRADGNHPRLGLLECEGDARRRHLHDLTPNGVRTCSGVSWKSRAPGRAVCRSIDGDEIARGHAAQRAGRAADPHVDERRRIALQLETRGELLQLERHAQAALDRLLAGHDQPEQHGQAERQHLQAEVLERPDRHHVYCTALRRARLGAACSTSACSRGRSASASRPRSICPSDDDRNLAGLLRHDDRDRVVFLGQSDGRAMARAELLAELRIDRERQKAGRRGHAVAPAR